MRHRLWNVFFDDLVYGLAVILGCDLASISAVVKTAGATSSSDPLDVCGGIDWRHLLTSLCDAVVVSRRRLYLQPLVERTPSQLASAPSVAVRQQISRPQWLPPSL